MLVRFMLKNPTQQQSLIVLTVNVGIFKIIDGKKSYQPFKYSTGLTIPSKYWNKKQYRVNNIKAFPQGKIINKTLDSIDHHFKDAYYTVIERERIATFDNLKRQLLINLGKLSVNTDFYATLDQFIADSKSGKRLYRGKRITALTIKGYVTTKNKLLEFNPTLSFHEINMDFYKNFLKFMYKKGYSDNYIGKHIKIIKTFMEESFDQHHNSAYQHKDFQKLQELTTKISLRQEELQIIADMDLSSKPKLERVRDVFLIGCNTALRYSDWYRIRKEHIYYENDRAYLKIGATFKTGAGVIIPINKTFMRVLEKYDFKLRLISNQKFNDYLKEVFKQHEKFNEKVEVIMTKGGESQSEFHEKWKLISTHTARRTAATNMYLAGIDTIAIMKITGHKSEATFLKYIRVTEMENAQRLADNPFFDS